MKKKWNLYEISNSRGIIMGFATIYVAFFHCYAFNFIKMYNNSFFGQLLHFIKWTGNVGVDIFLILSAVGLYFSFSKNSDIKSFYKKRMIRILPAVIIVAIIYYLYKRVDAFSFIKGVLLINIFTNGIRDFWYFSLIIILYLLFPLFYKIINNKGIKGLIALLLIVIGFNILLFNINYTYYQMIEILITRIPVFIIGVYLGKYVYEKKEVSYSVILLMLVMFLSCNALLQLHKFKYYMFSRYTYIFLGLSIIFLISYFHSLYKNKYIDKFLLFIGTFSMEVYLIFQKLTTEVLNAKLFNVNNYYIYYFIMFIITLLLSILLKKLCDFIVNLIEGKLKHE